MYTEVIKRFFGLSLLIHIIFYFINPYVYTIVGSTETDSLIISSSGTIIQGSIVEVSVDEDITIGKNNLSLGYMLHNEWSDWRDRAVLRELSSQADFKLIRLFSHKIEPCVYWDESTLTGTYNWDVVDDLIDKIFGSGAEPLICLGYHSGTKVYVPDGMETNGNSLPNPESYAAYATDWVEHFQVKGYPVKYYEIFNEIYHYTGWVADDTKLSKYFDLYEAVADSMRDSNSNVLISTDASILKKFLNGFINKNLKIDYIDFHKYDANDYVTSEEVILNRADTRYFEETSNVYGAPRAREIWYNEYGVTLPILLTEFNINAAWRDGSDPRIQQVFGAVWTTKVIRKSILNNIQFAQYFCFASHASWDQGEGKGFGMINTDNNQPWYPYYVQKLIGQNLFVGDDLLSSSTSSDDVSCLAWRHEGIINILIFHEYDNEKMLRFNGFTGILDIYKVDNMISWENPEIQQETMNADDYLTLYGYTVLLAQFVET